MSKPLLKMQSLFVAAIMGATGSIAHAEDQTQVVNLKQTRSCAGCDLSGAYLRVARIGGAKLAGADLSGADLISADLGRTDLSGADLSNANLIRASLVGATLSGTRMDGAVLNKTHLEDTDLSGAIGLTQAQLDRACGNANTRLPAGLTAKRCIGSEF